MKTLRDYIAENKLDPGTPVHGYSWEKWAELQLDLPATVLGTVKDGINRSEVVECNGGIILYNYQAGSQMYENRESWIESLEDTAKAEAESLLRKRVSGING